MFLESLAVELEQAGHHVEVLSGSVGYNSDLVEGEQRFQGPVRTLYSGPLHARRFVGKLLSWFCFYTSVALYLLTHRLPDKVVVMTTPPFLHFLFVIRNLFTRRPAQLILWNQDTYPEVLAAVGLIRADGWIYRLLARMERWCVRRVDKVIALDQAMQQLMHLHGAREARSIPHWDLPHPKETRRVTLPTSFLNRLQRYRYLVIYTGNYGWGHDLSALREWWERHPDQTDFFFLFIGGGCKWDALKEWQDIQQRDFLEVRSYVSKGEFSVLLELADFGLVSLDERCVGLMSPSKIHAYLGYGKPLIYIGPSGSNVSEAIQEYRCGFQCDQLDVDAIESCLAEIADENFEYARYQSNSLRAARSRYTESVGVREVREFILETRDSRSRPLADVTSRAA